MKIGILSLVLSDNYGGILQSYALQTVLERMGHEVIVLDRNREIHKSKLKQILSFIKHLLIKYLLGRNDKYKSPSQLNEEREKKEYYVRIFINKYIHIRMVDGIKEGVLDDRDAVVVGSDQVWRPRYFKKQWRCGIANAFLKYPQKTNVLKIAYAASFGTDAWEYSKKETSDCSILINKFKAVGVREYSATELCKSRLGFPNAKHVLDPTLLLEKEDYERLAEHVDKLECNSNMLLCYILDNTKEKKDLVQRIAEDKKLSVFYVNSNITGSQHSHGICSQLPVEIWLRGFMDAQFVVTDSFHACVFALIFKKPFVVVGNSNRGLARISSFLSMFRLDNHLVSICDYDKCLNYDIPIVSYEILKKYKKDSFEFLKNSIKK